MFTRTSFSLAYQLLGRRSGSLAYRTAFVLGAVIALWGGGACLYSDPINVPPTVTIVNNRGPIWRKEAITFSANTSDDVVKLEWAQVGCVIGSGSTASACRPCPVASNVNAGNMSWPTQGLKQMDEFDPPDTDLPSCIWAIVTDHYQAKTAATYALNPMNHPPRADIGFVNPVFATGTDQLRLYHEIELSSDGSTDDDGDPLTFHWHLVRPAKGSMLTDDPSIGNIGACAGGQSSTSWCFTPDVAGDYLVQLTVDDGYGQVEAPVSTVTRTISVAPDQLPCLISYDPMTALTYHDPTTPNNQVLQVFRVDDDGDPFPMPPMSNSGIHFKWFMGPTTDALVWQNNDSARFPINGNFSPGDQVIVRVEIYDRNVLQLDDVQRNCGDAQDTCSEIVGQTVCNQRWTWRVRY